MMESGCLNEALSGHLGAPVREGITRREIEENKKKVRRMEAEGRRLDGSLDPALRHADKPAGAADELARLRRENECLRALLGAALEAAFGPDWRDELRRGG